MTDHPPLFRHRWHQRLHDRIVSRLLWAANTSLPFGHREAFYALKDRLLRRYAIAVGHDVQHIRKPCWTCDGTGWYAPHDQCRRCLGSGIYRELYVHLSRWEFAGHIFHRPEGYVPRIGDHESVTIAGYVQHARLGRSAQEAALWLALIYDRRMFWRLLTRSGRGLGWYWHPLCNVERAIDMARGFARRFTPRRCWCGRRFLPLWERSHWCVCRRCRRRTPDEIEDVPF